MEIVTSFQFLGTHTSAEHHNHCKEGQEQQLHFLRVLKKNHLVRKNNHLCDLTCFT